MHLTKVGDKLQKVNPLYNPFENIDPYAFSHRLSTYPYGEAKYAPRLHVHAYHMSRGKKVHVQVCENEIVRLQIPKDYKLADTKQVVAENEASFFHKMEQMYDRQFDLSPDPLTYDSLIPFIGKELSIKIISADKKESIGQDTIYLHSGYTGAEIKETVLDLLADAAYKFLKPKFDQFSAQMKLKYSNLEIDDGRRTFGSFNIVTKEIFLSRRILMLSEPVIDFLIVHELAHGKTANHGSKHDSIIENTMPDFENLDYEFNLSVSQLIELGWA